jgi:hypothetical protein
VCERERERDIESLGARFDFSPPSSSSSLLLSA